MEMTLLISIYAVALILIVLQLLASIYQDEYDILRTWPFLMLFTLCSAIEHDRRYRGRNF